MEPPAYIGRLAPSPTGRLHLGHAQTFLVAAQRACSARGKLLLRMDDLDQARCRPEFANAALEDMHWIGLRWAEPVIVQSSRLDLYRAALKRLHAQRLIYPCHRSRRDLAEALSAPHERSPHPTTAETPDSPNTSAAQPLQQDEPVYPAAWRPAADSPTPPLDATGWATNWRFRVPDGRELHFSDGFFGPQAATAGTDFGDFLVWRKDGFPSYQLACAVDDAALQITEVVRGADLIRSTFRQILLLEAMGARVPAYFHAPLMTDDQGARLAKRHDALSLAALRERGHPPPALNPATGVLAW